MLAPVIDTLVDRAETPVRIAPTAEEIGFYEHYAWCINPHLTVREAKANLEQELRRIGELQVDWQRGEAAINVWLLGASILNAADERLRGKALKLPKPLDRVRPLRRASAAIERLAHDDKALRRWRDRWMSAFQRFLPMLLPDMPPEREAMARAAEHLSQCAASALPATFASDRTGIPSPFQRLDLTHRDVLALADRLMSDVPDRAVPIALIGLRTSGSYFAPLIKAALEAAGYRTVALATVEPNKGVNRAERRVLERLARSGALGVIIDDPPQSGGTLLAGLDIARSSGFALQKLRLLVPTHAAKRDWATMLPDSLVLTLAPEAWHKRSLLAPDRVEAALAGYIGAIKVLASERADAFTANLHSASPEKRVARLKRVYELKFADEGESPSDLFVLAKSVGCGWLSYHAFLAAHRLKGQVPAPIGLRDGILYSLYVPHDDRGAPDAKTIAAYVAARVRVLRLSPSAAGTDLKRHNNGVRLLELSLSRAYGGLATATLMRSVIGERLRALPCPAPTWIDGNMRADEWICAAENWLKTDYEHHGMGKGGLNVVDPAFDLASALLDLDLTSEAERDMVDRYAALSGDGTVGARMLVNKLMAGLWSMNRAQETLLGTGRGAEELQDAHGRFVAAWHALTVQTARFAGRFCRPATPPAWRSPLVLLDVDGVIDRRIFGFPAISAAGIAALAALNRHGCAVALNTARSVAEVQGYCEAYGLAGGVAEYGAYIWDAVRGEGRPLIDAKTAEQLQRLRDALSDIPGVFLDPRHRYSIRAFTYRHRPFGILGLLQTAKAAAVGEGAVSPLSPLLVQQVLHEFELDRLAVYQTTIDTTIAARDLDKGTGLRALRDWVVGGACETIAVGDSEADLPMFREATRSFAPANLSCHDRARLLGCEMVGASHQRGLLEIARRLGAPIEHIQTAATSEGEKLLLEIFAAADQPWMRHLLRALCKPANLRIFWQ